MCDDTTIFAPFSLKVETPEEVGAQLAPVQAFERGQFEDVGLFEFLGLYVAHDIFR